ncbi:MAG: RnfABCDGE type electron transport complex subunit D [Oscillospiraceae bacterium]|nr:RnfABCDGE type electron transport complex subunit D [Oscillospiraceae bacterium]
MNQKLNLSAGPHVRDIWSTSFIMRMVLLALTPATVIGVITFGLHALWVILASVITAVLTELVFDKLTGKPDTWKDGSAAVTGLMLALTLSAETPLYAPVIGSIFAILVVKCAFGGLGKNFVNPALAARCFLLISFSNAMTVYGIDGVASATPCAELAAGRTVDITSMFLGSANGVIGGSILGLLVGGLALWAFDIIHGQICFSVLGGFTLFMALFGGQGFDPGFLAAHLCGGGVVLGAFFMATDYVTSPMSRLGQTFYGALIGVLGALFRIKGQSADSFSYSIIVANLFVPLIDTYIVDKPYAFRKRALKLRSGEAKKPLSQRIPKPVIALSVIALLSGLALSGVFSMTKSTIDEQKNAAAAAAYKTVLPEAESFASFSDKVEFLGGEVYGTGYGRVYIKDALVGKDAAGNVVGYAVSVTSAEGYDGNVTLSIGVNTEGVINGISFTELHETPGKGMLCGEPAFMDQFAGKAADKLKLGEDVDGITGVTITSKAVVNAVNAGLDFINTQLRGE